MPQLHAVAASQRWIHDFPADRFLDSFISFTRAGAGGVENQCLGSLSLAAATRYGANFDRGVQFRLGGATFASKNEAEAVFGSITGMHQNAFNSLRFGGARGVDVKTLDGERWSFTELREVQNSGPFRVYQSPGYFNWKQGEYPEQKKANEVLVANTLRDDHAGSAAPLPFESNGVYYKTIWPMVRKTINALDP